MRRSKEEILCKLAGQTKIVIVVEAKVAFKEEVMVDTGIKEVFVEEERTRQANGLINLKFDVIIVINLTIILMTARIRRVAEQMKRQIW